MKLFLSFSKLCQLHNVDPFYPLLPSITNHTLNVVKDSLTETKEGFQDIPISLLMISDLSLTFHCSQNPSVNSQNGRECVPLAILPGQSAEGYRAPEFHPRLTGVHEVQAKSALHQGYSWWHLSGDV